MEIEFKNKKIEKICTDYGFAMRKIGKRSAEILRQRIIQIRNSVSAEYMIEKQIGRCHELKGDRKGQYAVDLEHPYRLVFTVIKKAGSVAVIIEIVDYH